MQCWWTDNQLWHLFILPKGQATLRSRLLNLVVLLLPDSQKMGATAKTAANIGNSKIMKSAYWSSPPMWKVGVALCNDCGLPRPIIWSQLCHISLDKDTEKLFLTQKNEEVSHRLQPCHNHCRHCCHYRRHHLHFADTVAINNSSSATLSLCPCHPPTTTTARVESRRSHCPTPCRTLPHTAAHRCTPLHAAARCRTPPHTKSVAKADVDCHSRHRPNICVG